jgi:hypothetical protein
MGRFSKVKSAFFAVTLSVVIAGCSQSESFVAVPPTGTVVKESTTLPNSIAWKIDASPAAQAQAKRLLPNPKDITTQSTYSGSSISSWSVSQVGKFYQIQAIYIIQNYNPNNNYNGLTFVSGVGGGSFSLSNQFGLLVSPLLSLQSGDSYTATATIDDLTLGETVATSNFSFIAP